ncbi:hypothetical protein B6D52_02280 [Candidatus Parcubacteria bacterium 4484_255]|nr:MAG: hypothetical protein B6D52_02280 [Candidatus Parcubacteria bacterium 4484_255]
MQKQSIIRTIYLYIFSLLGLVLLIIGGVRFVNMGLKAFVFTQADEQQRIDFLRPPLYHAEVLQKISDRGLSQFSAEEKEQIKSMIRAHKVWAKRRDAIDPLVSRRHKDASISLAMILIGLPLYLTHWKMVKKECKA